jgi:hypothetical protein
VSPAWAAAVDDATVALLEATSWRDERDHLRDCAHCGRPFWVHQPGARYCSQQCRQLAYYHRRTTAAA